MVVQDFRRDNWTKKDYERLVKYLNQLSEEEYRQFSSKLIPGCDKILGVRMPKIRTLAKMIAQGNWREYLSLTQTDTFEEIALKGAVIGLVAVNFDEMTELVDAYVKLVSNWAICDYFCGGLKRIKKFEKEFLPYIEKYLTSENPWICRVGIVLLKTYYVKEENVFNVLKLAETAEHEHYYVHMAQAWLVAECYTKFPELTYSYLEKSSFSADVLNKAVQKIKDSYRVDKKWKEKALVFCRKN